MLPFEQVVIEVTQACNHACVHCYNYWREDRRPVNAPGALSREEIRHLVRDICSGSKLKSVAFSGGEPTLREDLGGIAADMMALELGVLIVSNGSQLTKARAATFPSGTGFEFTLFSAQAEVHDRIAGRVGAFERVIEAAIAVQRRQCRLAMACVLSRLNLEGLEETLELALALGAEGILFNRINLAASTVAHAAALVPSAEELAGALAVADGVAGRFGAAVSIAVPIPPCVVDPSPYTHLHFGWCPRGGTGAYYTIGYNGLVRPCNHASVVLGDVRQQSFERIVLSQPAKAFWAGLPTECQTCTHPLRDLCRGGCPASSHECFGTPNRRDPFVSAACAQRQSAVHASQCPSLVRFESGTPARQ